MQKKEAFILTGSQGKKIIGDITYSKSNSDLFALFVHGFKGFKDWGAHNLVADYFSNHDINYVKFNFSHSGVPVSNPIDVTNMELFASNTPSKELFDLEVVINYLKAKFPKAAITLIGHSRGGGISILEASTNTEINKLITWAAISSFNSLWKKEQEKEWIEKRKIEVYNARTKEYMPLNVELLEDVNKNHQKLNILHAAEKLSKPWLIVHGNDDINVNIETGKNFKNNNPSAEFIEIDGANHVFGASHPYHEKQLPEQLLKVCNASINFIKQNL